MNDETRGSTNWLPIEIDIREAMRRHFPEMRLRSIGDAIPDPIPVIVVSGRLRALVERELAAGGHTVDDYERVAGIRIVFEEPNTNGLQSFPLD